MRRTDPLLVTPSVEQPRTGRVAWCDVDVELRCEVAELRQPEAVLVDEVEREPVAPGRDRPAHLQVALDALAGRGVDVLADSGPADRVAPVVEPVVRGLEPAPRCRSEERRVGKEWRARWARVH